MKELSYTTVTYVLESWELAKRQPNFAERVGILALLKLFDLEPRTKLVFGFDIDYEPTPTDLKSSGNLLHAIRMVDMFDAAFGLLGPDTQTLEEVLQQLGRRHIKYGVKPPYYAFMQKAVLLGLEDLLGDAFTDEIREAWVEVYDELSGEIIKSILNNRDEVEAELGLRPLRAGAPVVATEKKIPTVTKPIKSYTEEYQEKEAQEAAAKAAARNAEPVAPTATAAAAVNTTPMSNATAAPPPTTPSAENSETGQTEASLEQPLSITPVARRNFSPFKNMRNKTKVQKNAAAAGFGVMPDGKAPTPAITSGRRREVGLLRQFWQERAAGKNALVAV